QEERAGHDVGAQRQAGGRERVALHDAEALALRGGAALGVGQRGGTAVEGGRAQREAGGAGAGGQRERGGAGAGRGVEQLQRRGGAREQLRERRPEQARGAGPAVEAREAGQRAVVRGRIERGPVHDLRLVAALQQAHRGRTAQPCAAGGLGAGGWPASSSSAAWGRRASITKATCSASGVPSRRAPSSISKRSTLAAKPLSLSFLSTDFASRVLMPPGRTSAQAPTKPVSSSHASRALSSGETCGTPHFV